MDLSKKLYKDWVQHDPKMTQEILSQDQCDIGPEFMCFAEIYASLARLIPIEWTVIDFGCAFAPQCWYFRKHNRYIGIDPGPMKRFQVDNSSIFIGTIRQALSDTIWIEPINWDRTFGIMSYVPAKEYDYFLVKNHLKNMFVYYPSSDPIRLKKSSKKDSDLR